MFGVWRNWWDYWRIILLRRWHNAPIHKAGPRDMRLLSGCQYIAGRNDVRRCLMERRVWVLFFIACCVDSLLRFHLATFICFSLADRTDPAARQVPEVTF